MATRISAGAAALLMFSLAGCGGSSGPSHPSQSDCGPSNCAGCCMPDGLCQIPSFENCGEGGGACRACLQGQQCVSGVCMVPEGASDSSGSSGSDSSGSTGSATGSSSGSSASSASSASSSTGSSGSGSGGSSASSSGSSSGSSTGGQNCCYSMDCVSGCDPVACVCLTVDPGDSGSTGGEVDAGDICASQNCVIYAETAHILYQVDPTPPNALTRICNFGGDISSSAGVNDIAVTRDGSLYGVTRTDIYAIDPQTCAGTHVSHLQTSANYNCLTFSDQDTLLAADSNGLVVTVDVATGQATDAGHFGGGMGCSGDIVGLQDGTIYATAKFINDGGGDYLVRLNPAQGYHATRVSNTPIGFRSIYGLGYWAGTLYGFDFSGHVLAINPQSGTATLLHTESGTDFYGAGTTPLAPVVVVTH